MKDEFAKVRDYCDQHSDEGAYQLRACLEVTLWYHTVRDQAAGIRQFYDRSLELIQPHLTFYSVGDNFRMRKLTKRAFEVIPHWLDPQTEEQSVYCLRLEGGNSVEEVSDRAFDLYEFMFPGYIRLVLPLEYLDEAGVAGFAQLAGSLAENIEFISGWAGYGANVLMDFPSGREGNPLYAVSRRFRGIDVGVTMDFGRYATQFLKTINWLTFVGDELLGKTGGREKLSGQLGDGIVVHDLPHGVMIQAGPKPEFGDTNRQEKLPYYHQVGQALKELRIPDEEFGRDNSIAGEENTRDWLTRFFRDPED